MILRGLSLLNLLLIATQVRANPAQEVAQISAVLNMQEAAWNRGDIDGFMTGYDRSHATVFVSGDTLTRGWQTVRNRYQKKYKTQAQMGELTFADVEITLLGSDSAMATGRWKLRRKSDHPHGRFTLILRRSGNGWRIVHDHTS
jgi:ketosteroid isomerase-like protein